MAGNASWRKNAETHKMSPEEVKRTGVDGSRRPPGNNPGEVLHQRRKLPFSATTMAVTGICGVVCQEKPEASGHDVAKVATGTADPRDTHPRK
ncbi:unnamed protein product [Dovyalis caffra]|uniref:Uncharacterized protein n=1 Tax=Dovyalis caffra TaxID=77055 RepID=A0AAV1SPZ8_9ROSI|nr:unnamed protein product [Dovyalis caffra]